MYKWRFLSHSSIGIFEARSLHLDWVNILQVRTKRRAWAPWCVWYSFAYFVALIRSTTLKSPSHDKKLTSSFSKMLPLRVFFILQYHGRLPVPKNFDWCQMTCYCGNFLTHDILWAWRKFSTCIWVNFNFNIAMPNNFYPPFSSYKSLRILHCSKYSTSDLAMIYTYEYDLKRKEWCRVL